jgi:hypothetical protein
MHLQVRSKVTTSSPNEGPGAMSSTEATTGITRTDPGRLVRLLELLAEDRSGDPGDGHGPFNLTVAAGTGIELTGTFIFAVAADKEHDPDQERKEHERALTRIADEFPDSVLVERLHREIPHREGALHGYLRELSDRGLLIDEIVVGVATCQAGTEGPCMVPVQVSVVEARTGL